MAAAVAPPRLFDLNGGDDGESGAALAAAGFAALAPPSSTAVHAFPAPAATFGGASSPLWAAPPKGKRSSGHAQQQAPKQPNQHLPASWARAAERVLGNGGGGASASAPAPASNPAADHAIPANNSNGAAPVLPFSQFILKK